MANENYQGLDHDGFVRGTNPHAAPYAGHHDMAWQCSAQLGRTISPWIGMLDMISTDMQP